MDDISVPDSSTALPTPIMEPGRDPETFAANFAQMLNHAAIVTMVSIGHRLHLFDVMATLPPSTSEEIAASCGLSERYVREWLAVMTTGGIVDYYPENRLYALDGAHASCLTRAATPNNLAVTAQLLPLMGSVEQRLLACFRTGEGMAYGDYPCFHQTMAEDSYQTVVSALFDHILPLVPGLSERLRKGIDVLDAGCGGGQALLAMAQAFPASRFTGYDLCEEAFTGTRQQATALGLTNLVFEARDLLTFDEPGRYDLVTTFDAVHDQPDPAGLLRGIARCLRPGGVYLMQDIAGSSYLEKNLDHPLGPLLYSISCVHCMPVSLGQGGPGLGTLWGEEYAERLLRQAGFRSIQATHLEHDPFNVYFVARVTE